MRTLLLAALTLAPAPLLAQSSEAFADPVAAELVARARAARGIHGASVTSYTAVVRERGAAMLRMPLRDRLLARSESAARVRWARGGETVVQLLASRSQEPEGVDASRGFDADLAFDPLHDRIYFGLGDFVDVDEADEEKDLWILHPLAAGSEESYRYRSGDTLAVAVSGRRIRAVELHVIPRSPSFHHLNATLWIEPESGALVQAVFRPARPIDFLSDPEFLEDDGSSDLGWIPGFLRPIEADLESVVVQYALWDLTHWLPRLSRVEGYVRAGGMRVPFSREVSYEIESVEAGAAGAVPGAEAVLAAWNPGVPRDAWISPSQGDSIRVFAPRDDEALLRSEALPAPIWEEAPEFAAEGELESLVEGLARDVPRERRPGSATIAFQWGPDAPDLLRYNRVEGFSVGARALARTPVGDARATLRLGAADLVPNVEVAASVPGRTRGAEGALYHRLAAADPWGGALGVGNSLGAILLGRDNGEYYRATGARVSVVPAETRRSSYRLSAFAERQRAAERGTVWSAARMLGSRHDLRPNLPADEVDLVGASATLAPWWGVDPLAPRAGVELFAEAAAGDREFARSRATARTVLPLSSTLRLGAEAGAGTSWGDSPVQYAWFLGGPETLRGYAAGTAAGRSFLRTRLEVARSTGTRTLALFTDGGWTGDRDAFDLDDALLSAGVGASLLDGIVRLDLVRALRDPVGWRVEIYLDALL